MDEERAHLGSGGEEGLDEVERAVRRLRDEPEEEAALDILEQAVKGLEEAGDRLEEEG